MGKGSCCQTCKPEESSCHVRGKNFDLFKTFDGLRYRLKGACMYEFARDCDQDQFKIRIRYAAHGAKKQSTIDLVLITLGTTKIKLYKDMKIRVNRTRLSSYNSNKLQTFDIVVRSPLLIVRDKTLGIKVSWNVFKRLTVKVDKKFIDKGRLCGLCGNLNGVKQDDFSAPKGGMILTPTQLADAWRRGSICDKKAGISSHRLKDRNNAKLSLSTEKSQVVSHANIPGSNKRPKSDGQSTNFAKKRISSIPNFIKRHERKGGQMTSLNYGHHQKHQILTSRNIFSQLRESPNSSRRSDDERHHSTLISREGKERKDFNNSSQIRSVQKSYETTNNLNTDAGDRNDTVSKVVLALTETHQDNVDIKINESGTADADMTLVEEDETRKTSLIEPGVVTKSGPIQGRQSRKKNVPCDSNSLDWASAQDECLRIRNWMFFTCAGSLNVGLMTRECVDDICGCHGNESCQRKVISKHVDSCQPLPHTGHKKFTRDANNTNGSHVLTSDNR